MHDEKEVLAAAQKLFDSVKDGVIIVRSKEEVNGGEVWQITHQPDQSGVDNNPILEMAMKKIRQGSISLYPLGDDVLYEMSIYGSTDGFMKTDEGWTEVHIPAPMMRLPRGIERRISEVVREQNENVMIMSVEPAFNNRTLLMKGVDSSTREPVSAIISLNEDMSDIEEVRFPKDQTLLEM